MRRLSGLLVRLPDDAWLRTSERSREAARQNAAWGPLTELVALVVELLSIQAAEQKIRKPIDVPRPEWVRPKSQGVAHAVNVLRRTARRVSRG